MLEIGRVVDPRREQHHPRSQHSGRQLFQHVPQPARIIRHRPNPHRGEHLRKRPLHHLPVLEQIGNPGRTPEVVLQNIDLTILVPNQVGAGDVAPDASGRPEAGALRPIGGRTQHDLPRNHAVTQDPLVVIHIVDEQIQRPDPLLQPALNPRPLRGRYDSRHQIEWENPFRTLFVPIDIEGDPQLQKRAFRRVLALRQFTFGQTFDVPDQGPHRFPRSTVFLEELIVERSHIIVGKLHIPSLALSSPFTPCRLIRLTSTHSEPEPLAMGMPWADSNPTGRFRAESMAAIAPAAQINAVHRRTPAQNYPARQELPSLTNSRNRNGEPG